MSSALCVQLIVSGYIMAVYRHQEETYGGVAPGQTPVRRKTDSQTQVRQTYGVVAAIHHLQVCRTRAKHGVYGQRVPLVVGNARTAVIVR